MAGLPPQRHRVEPQAGMLNLHSAGAAAHFKTFASHPSVVKLHPKCIVVDPDPRIILPDPNHFAGSGCKLQSVPIFISETGS
jgi:hypothetical protein